jgi:hypothetical protein
MGKLKERVERHIRVIGALEEILTGPRPYTWKGQILEWGKDMPPGFRSTMYEDAEVAILLDMDGEPTWFLFVDANNTLREGAL